MNYPLHLKFKVLALTNSVSITDQSGAMLMFMKQKMFKLKEQINIFSDETQSQLKYTINADRVIDFSANYLLADAQQSPLGSVHRHGMKSLWSAEYDLTITQGVSFKVTEANPWVKFLDALLSQVPLLGMFSGYFLHPTYLVKTAEGQVVMRLQKQPAFFERYFTIEKVDPALNGQKEIGVVLGVLMVTLLESMRG